MARNAIKRKHGASSAEELALDPGVSPLLQHPPGAKLVFGTGLIEYYCMGHYDNRSTTDDQLKRR